MSDVTTLSQRLSNLDVSPQFDSYSKVIIHVSDDAVIEVGNDDGRTLELDNPFGTQAMAQTILDSLRGFQYQPYEATGALLDPAAEIGDAANMRGNYGGIYTRSRTFGRLMKADISAPHDEEINHEYKYESPQERQFKRQIDDVKASLIIANDRIDAKVSQTGGTNSTFGWSLTSSAHTWYANGSQVMKISKAGGLEVSGKVTATSGKIGGFTIGASAIYNNISSFGGSQSSGVYIGTNGIQLGQRFKVDSSGNVSASNMTLSGTLKIGSTTITADNLRLGAERANSGYSSWNGTTSTVNSSGSYWSGGASYGYNYNAATVNGTSSYPSYFTAGTLISRGNVVAGAAVLATTYIALGNSVATWKSATLRTSAGGITTIHYLGY